MRVDLQWREEFEPVLSELDRRLAARETFKPWNTLLVARALLRLLKHDALVTHGQVIDYVLDVDEPVGGWIAFDRQKWLAYVPRVVEVLKSDSPMDVLKL